MKRSKKLTSFISATFLTISGCASTELERKLSVAEERQSEITMYAKKEIVAWNADKIRSGVKATPSDTLTETIKDRCQHIFESGINDIQKETFRVRLSESSDPYADAKALAERVTTKLDECANEHGAVAQFRLVNADGAWYEIDDWVYRVDRYNKKRKQALSNLEEAREKERIAAAAIGGLAVLGAAAAAVHSNSGGSGGYVNPNQHWVNGYFRSDGTYIPGHWRTNPNNVCWDNLNGCR